jgi:hypothetical protein
MPRRHTIAEMLEATQQQREGALDRTIELIELLASEIGPRRPTGSAEREAADRMAAELERTGVGARVEPIEGYSSFFAPYAPILAAALAPALLPRRRRLARGALALAAAAGLVTEGGLVWTPLSDALSRRPSHNVIAEIEPRSPARRTLCLVCHLDTSRSGLMFDPALAPFLTRWISLQSAAGIVQGAEPLLARSRAGRAVLCAARAILAIGLGLLVERELCGTDVPGANDNASGAAIVAQLGAELATDPPDATRVLLLMTGCEEAGVLGAQSFVRGRDTSGWLFLNFDSVGGSATLRYLRREGVIRKWGADAGLIAVAEALARRRPELELESTDDPAGLTYDTSVVLARGGRALTLSAQDETIPNLHLPSDTLDNVDRDVVARTLEVGRELIAAVDRGEAG